MAWAIFGAIRVTTSSEVSLAGVRPMVPEWHIPVVMIIVKVRVQQRIKGFIGSVLHLAEWIRINSADRRRIQLRAS